MAQEDRFTTHWSGPSDPGAMYWAVALGINYNEAGFRVINSGRRVYGMPLFLYVPDPTVPHADWRQENVRHDTHNRNLHAQLHALDTDLETGFITRIAQNVEWRYRTRGEKLRYCRDCLQACQGGLSRIQSRIQEIDTAINRNPDAGNAFEMGCLATAREDETLLTTYVQQTRVLETLVQGETAQGWDWRVGLQHQGVVRRSMRATHISRETLYNSGWQNVTQEAAYILGFEYAPRHEHIMGIGLFPTGKSLVVRDRISVIHPPVY